MTNITWPAELGSPLRSGYSYTLPKPNNLKATIGPSRSRNRRAKDNTHFNVSYLWEDSQIERFNLFCKQDTDHMTKFFTQRLKLGADLVEQSVRIVEVKPYKRERFRWRCQLSLECPDRFVIDDSTAKLILSKGPADLNRSISASERYHRMINSIIPNLWLQSTNG